MTPVGKPSVFMMSHDLLSGLLCLNRRGLLAIAVSLNMISNSDRRRIFRAGYRIPRGCLASWRPGSLIPRTQFAVGHCLAPVQSAFSCRLPGGEP